ncbi:MAG: gamma-glutamyltransferase, partial [Chloroflexota bacterium]
MRDIPSETTVQPAAVAQGRPAVLGSRHMVSSSHYLASLAGLRMFPRGGSAIDAGIAAGIALNVVERHLTDFGGVAPIMVYLPGMAEPETIDGLGRWPASLDLATYRARYGDDMPIGIPRSVTPGAPDAWLTALARYGRLTLADVLAPAIELCDGFPVFPRLAVAIERLEGRIRQWPSSAAVFLPGGRPPRAGEILVQPELGRFFRRLVAIESAHSTRGRAAAIMAARDAIYRGDIAREIVAFMEREGGALGAEDLEGHRATTEPAVHTTYRGIDVYACGPWSQGPLVPMTLNMLEGFDIASMGPGSLAFLHRFTEA